MAAVLRGSSRRYVLPRSPLHTGLTLDFRLAQRHFFDRKRIQKVIRDAGLDPKRLDRAAKFVQQRARSSMRYVRRRTYYSTAPAPPHAHVENQIGNLIRRKNGRKGTNFGLKVIFRAYSPAHRGAIVGPVGPRGRGNPSGKTVPEVHEFGGTLLVPDMRTRGTGGRRRLVPARYPKRPYMGPALKKEAPKFPALWRNSIAGVSVMGGP